MQQDKTHVWRHVDAETFEIAAQKNESSHVKTKKNKEIEKVFPYFHIWIGRNSEREACQCIGKKYLCDSSCPYFMSSI